MLQTMTTRVNENNSRASRFYNDTCKQLFTDTGKEDFTPPIKHVVLIQKENKTYDEVLGDLQRDNKPYGNGDPELCLFGEQFTPNVHELARQFVNFDNYYANADESTQGHMWMTQADCNDLMNKYRFDRLPIVGVDPATRSETGSIFDLCYNNNVTFRNYGQVANFGFESLNKYREFMNVKYPYYNMSVKDVDKAKEFIREMKNGIFPEFVYLMLPNDHTFGGSSDKPTPQTMVADNDHAVGMVVDAISKSEYWESTIIFILEDDPQSAAGDHVDAHRSILVVVSPWVKRGYLSSVLYSIPSVYRTIEMLLGLPHLNGNTAMAAPMYDIFTTEPDFSSYDHIVPNVLPAMNPKGTEAAKSSEKYDWNEVDGHKGLGDIIWSIMRPGQERPSHAKIITD